MSNQSTAKRLTAYAGIRELIAKDGVKSAFNSARVCSYEAVELLYIANECSELDALSDEIGIQNAQPVPISSRSPVR